MCNDIMRYSGTYYIIFLKIKHIHLLHPGYRLILLTHDVPFDISLRYPQLLSSLCPQQSRLSLVKHSFDAIFAHRTDKLMLFLSHLARSVNLVFQERTVVLESLVNNIVL